MCLLCEHRKTRYDPQWLTLDKRDAKTQTNVHIYSKWLHWEIHFAICKWGLGLDGESPCLLCFGYWTSSWNWLLSSLLPFIASAGDPQAFKAIFSPRLVINLRTGTIYPALSFCDTNTHSSWTPRNSQRTLAILSHCFLMWHWLNLFLKSEL